MDDVRRVAPKGYIEAGKISRFILRRAGAVAVRAPWGTVYYLKEYYDSKLKIHEDVHLAQIARFGPAKFSILYLYYWLVHGYTSSPLEREAYMAEAIAEKTWLPMATAPKDGSKVLLLFCDLDKRFAVSGRWDANMSAWLGPFLSEIKPLAWLPLPDMYGEIK